MTSCGGCPVDAADPTLQPLPPLAARAHPTSSRSCSRCARSRDGSRPRPQEADELEREILGHVRALVPELLDEPGVGPIVAAQLIVTWSHHDRVRSEAAFARLAGVAPLPASSGSDDPPPPQPRRRPPTQPRPPHRRPPPPPTRPGDHATTSPAASPKARAPATRPASSSATSPATSTASCRTRPR